MASIKHGHCVGGSSREYRIWGLMLRRCNDPKHKDFARYGQKGIRVSPRWRSFENFIHDVGLAPSPEHTLDRFPNKEGNYEPGNIRWATRKEQAQNRRDNVNLSLNGKTQSLAMWAQELRIHEDTIRSRINKYGWSVEKALTTPPARRQARRT